jgi:hypothetical protein
LEEGEVMGASEFESAGGEALGASLGDTVELEEKEGGFGFSLGVMSGPGFVNSGLDKGLGGGVHLAEMEIGFEVIEAGPQCRESRGRRGLQKSGSSFDMVCIEEGESVLEAEAPAPLRAG